MTALIYTFSSAVLFLSTVTLSLLRSSIDPLVLHLPLVVAFGLMLWGIFSKSLGNRYGVYLGMPFIAASMVLYGFATLREGNWLDIAFVVFWGLFLVFDIMLLVGAVRRLGMGFVEAVSPDNFNEPVPRRV